MENGLATNGTTPHWAAPAAGAVAPWLLIEQMKLTLNAVAVMADESNTAVRVAREALMALEHPNWPRRARPKAQTPEVVPPGACCAEHAQIANISWPIKALDAKLEVSLNVIAETVAEQFRVPPGILYSKNREQHVAFSRQAAMYLCRRLTGKSFPAIGEHFNRDHTTAIHGCNLIKKRVN